MENEILPDRKKGRPAGTPTEKYTLTLETETAEWGKKQPGGLSELVRRLLREEMKKGQ